MARQSTQGQRREDIRRAAHRLLRRRDAGSIALKDVARELGLTANAVRYYYPDMVHLLEDLIDRGVERFETERAAAIAQGEKALDRLAVLIALGLPEGPHDRKLRLLWRVLILGLGQDRTENMVGTFGRQVAMYQGVLDTGSATGEFSLTVSSWDAARILVSLEDYMGLRIVADDPALDRVSAIALMRSYAGSVIGRPLPEIL